MAFLAPFLLMAAAALAVPLFVHRVRREESTVRSFPALRYLARTVDEQERASRFEELLLLALRLAAMALLVLGAARLVLPIGEGGQPPGDVVIVVDNGVHSSAVVDDQRILDALVARGREAIGTLGPLDRVWIVEGGRPWNPSTPRTPGAAIDELEALRPTATQTDMGRLIERAGAILGPASDGPRQVLLLSTLAPSTLPATADGLSGGGTDGLARASVLLQGPGLERPPNRGIASVQVGGGLPPRAEQPSTIEVRLAGDNLAGVAVRLRLGEEFVAATRSDADGRAELPLAPATAGWLSGLVEIDPDALRMDDQRPFAALVRPPPVIAVLGAPHRYLTEAIETLADAGRIRTAEAGTAAVELVLHVDDGSADDLFAGASSENRAWRSRDVVHVVIAPADPGRIPAVNRLLEDLGVPWRYEPGAPDATSALEPAADQPAVLAGLTVSTALHPVPMAAAPDRSQVLIHRADGHPWLIRTRGADPPDMPVMLVGSSLAPGRSEIPTSAAMIPFLDRLLTPVRRDGAGPSPTELTAGDPLIPGPGATELRDPDGIVQPLATARPWVETGRAGLYALLDSSGGRIRPVAVQVPSEAVEGGRSLDLDEAARRAGPGAEAASRNGSWTGAILADRRGREVAGFLALAALLILVLESWVAARIDRRTAPSHPQPEIR